jgi:hypothetical protein
MTQDEIIEMAMLEAEFVSHGKPSEEESELFVCTDKDIVRFAKLVAAKALSEQERNFCSRCGKRTADLTTIHTCTPPQD